MAARNGGSTYRFLGCKAERGHLAADYVDGLVPAFAGVMGG